MAEETSTVDSPQASAFLEVTCKSSGKKSRFAAGTKAGFAVSLVNRKLDIGNPLALHIVAVKDGEEPINFGPDAVLVDYGSGWKLQTVTELDYGVIREGEEVKLTTRGVPTVTSSDSSHAIKRGLKPGIGFVYIGKILLAFIIMFLLGGILTLVLENLPRLVLFINSFMEQML